jgi:hypothetical protein
VQIYLDDTASAFTTTGDAPLATLIAEAKAKVAPQGRMLVGIQCDGLDVTGEDFTKYLVRPVQTYARIDLQSADAAALATDGLQTARALIESTETAIPGIVQQLAEGDLAGAMPQLGECCRAWLQIHEGICNVATLRKIDPAAAQADGVSMLERLAVPGARLKQLRDALEAKDLVLVSDVLAYEFPEAFAAWRTVIGGLTDPQIMP